jgi:hypothetical protein
LARRAPLAVEFVIITGMGRSGSTFLADLLDQSGAQEARHEHFADRTFLHLSYYVPDHPFLHQELRRQRHALEARLPPAAKLVDVNPWLRYGTEAVREVLGRTPCFQLVRDGRKVVSSMYRHKSYTPQEKSLPLLPDEPEALAAWHGWSRFERLCWLWQRSVRRLLEQQVPTVRLEALLDDYDYLARHLLEPAGLTLDRAVWERRRHRPRNRGRPRLANLLRGRAAELRWSDQHERRFAAICGETMAAVGYPERG